MFRYTAVLDSGAGSSFITRSDFPLCTERIIKTLPTVTVKGSNGEPLSLNDQIRLDVPLGTKPELVTFYEAKQLITSIISRFDFWDRHLKAIWPRSCPNEFGDGKTIPILSKPSTHLQKAPLLPCRPVTNCTSHKPNVLALRSESSIVSYYLQSRKIVFKPRYIRKD